MLAIQDCEPSFIADSDNVNLRYLIMGYLMSRNVSSR